MLDFPRNGVPHVQNGTGTIRFGGFEADLHSGEVRKSGIRVKLQEQPSRLLLLLLERRPLQASPEAGLAKSLDGQRRAVHVATISRWIALAATKQYQGNFFRGGAALIRGPMQSA